jgi:hypothetical protein
MTLTAGFRALALAILLAASTLPATPVNAASSALQVCMVVFPAINAEYELIGPTAGQSCLDLLANPDETLGSGYATMRPPDSLLCAVRYPDGSQMLLGTAFGGITPGFQQQVAQICASSRRSAIASLVEFSAL